MRVLVLAFLWVCVSGVKAWEINQMDERLSEPLSVIIDSASNVFVISSHPDTPSMRRLFKLDSEKNILLEVDVVDSIANIFLSSNDDFYLTTWTNESSTHIYTIRAGDLKWERIFSVDDHVLVYMDTDGNFLYNAEYFGVYFLKFNTTEPVKVKYLDGFSISGAVITDKIGDTYLGGFSARDAENVSVVEERQLVVISAVSKESTPEGLLVGDVHENPNEFIYDLKVTGNNDLLISISDGNTEGVLKKYSNNTLTSLLSDESYQYYKLAGNDKITLITSCDYYFSERCRLSYLTLDGEIVEISNLQNETTKAENFNYAFSEFGNVYISDLEKIDQSPLEFLNYMDTATIPVDFNTTIEVEIGNILLDGNENLWILTNNHGIFYLEKGSFNPELVPGTEELGATQFNVDKRTNEIFVWGANKFFFISK